MRWLIPPLLWVAIVSWLLPVGALGLWWYFYPQLPQTYPVHWDFEGHANGWATKSIASALATPVLAFYILGFLALIKRDLPLMKARLAKLNPPPAGPMPFLIGGSGPKVTLRLVAEHAQMWHSFGDREAYEAKAAILAEHCAKVGRDPSEIERVWGAGSRTLEVADELADAGVHEITLGVGGDGTKYDLGELRELIQWRDRRNAAAA